MVQLRNLTWLLTLILMGFLLFTVILPLIGFVLFVLVAVLAVGALLYFAAPFLAKLPWFRDRIHVNKRGQWRSVRFGGAQFTSYQAWPGEEEQRSQSVHEADPNVIDVGGRELSPSIPSSWDKADEIDVTGRALPESIPDRRTDKEE